MSHWGSLHMLEIKWDVTVSGSGDWTVLIEYAQHVYLPFQNVRLLIWLHGGAPRRLCNMFTFIHLADAHIQRDFIFHFFLHEGNSMSSSSWEIIFNCLQYKKNAIKRPICRKHKTFNVSSHSVRNYMNHINEIFSIRNIKIKIKPS